MPTACPHCAAPLRFASRATRTECQYCGATVDKPRPRPMGLLADEDGDGMPDLLESFGAGATGAVHAVLETKYVFGGVAYESPDDMPAHVREAFAGIGNMDWGDAPATRRTETVRTVRAHVDRADRPAPRPARTLRHETLFSPQPAPAAPSGNQKLLWILVGVVLAILIGWLL